MENKYHINSLELQAAFFCLKAFCKNKTRLHVLLKLDIWITASHVPGVKNTTADLRSHLFYDNKEWSLNERAAKPLFDQFGKPGIDLFASCLNSKCPKYASYKPDPDSDVSRVFLGRPVTSWIPPPLSATMFGGNF